MRNLFRIGVFILIGAVIFATLGPPRYRPHAPLGQGGEHALAFILVGLAAGLAFPRRRLLVVALSVILIGQIEILQLWAPGRHRLVCRTMERIEVLMSPRGWLNPQLLGAS